MPDAPTNFTVIRAGIDHFYQGLLSNKAALQLTWTNNAPGATHRIQRQAVGLSGWVNTFRSGDGQSVAFIHGLALNINYRFRIRAENPDGAHSAWVLLDADPIHTPAMPANATQIDPPTNLTVAQNDFRGVLLTWDDNAENENAYILHVEGPGLADGGIEVFVDHLFSGSKNLPIAVPLAGPSALRFNSTYTAKLRARGGRQTRLSNTLLTDWTADVTFVTAAPHIAIVNLPVADYALPVVWRGEMFHFRVETNLPGTLTIVGGALPAGLSLAGDAITGTTTDAAGIFTVSIRASDDTTDDTQPLKLSVETPEFHFTNLPAEPTAWLDTPFLFRLFTNTPATTITHIAGSLPPGIAFVDDTISGTLPEAVSFDYVLTFRAENALGTTDTRQLTIHARVPALITKLKPHDSADVPQPGPEWGEVNATLGALFDWDVSVTVIGPIEAGGTVTLDNAPEWLTLSGTRISGTPDVSDVWDIGVTWTSGAYSDRTTLRVRVKLVRITSADELTVFADAPFDFPLTSVPPAVFTSPDDLPADIEIFPPDTIGQVLRGIAHEVGDLFFQLLATAGLDQDAQDFTLHVLPLITLGNGTDTIEGWLSDPLLERLEYHGPCEVEHWYLSGAPPGVEIGTLDCPGAYAGSRNIVAITGIPTAAGFFDATVTAHVCCDGMPRLHRAPIRFEISGGLFLSWLHDDPTLYDLQFQIRGDVPHRRVQSWYQRDASTEAKASETTTDTATPGVERITSTETMRPAISGNLLTAKRGDNLRLALLVRDGRKVLGTADGIANVALAFRLPDSADEEYLFDLPATPTTRNGHEFFLVELEVTQELLDELMGDDSVSGSSPGAPAIETLAEIRCTFNGLKISSATFPVTFVEDVQR